MRKRLGLIKRRPDLSRAEMQDYWRHRHGPLVANVENYWNFTERYIQNHTLDIDTPRVPIPAFDGVLETWQRERENPQILFADTQEYREIMQPDELNFIDRSGSISLVAEANPIIDGPREGIKLMSFMLRRADISHEEFVHHWRDIHAPMVFLPNGVAPFFKRYVQHYVVPGTEIHLDGRPSPFGFDGVLELWFDSIEQMNACFASPEYHQTLVPDEPRFTRPGSVRFLLAEVEFTAEKRTS